MKIYLMQHGLANPIEVDKEEGLSAVGENGILQSAKGLKKMGIYFDLIITSPKKRARMTAQIVSQELGIKDGKIEISDKVKAAVPAAESINLLYHYMTEKKHVLIVGHLPSLSEIAKYLLSSNDVEISITHGCLCCIESDDLLSHRGILRFLLSSEQLGLMNSSPK